jgi:hypothetical protein
LSVNEKRAEWTKCLWNACFVGVDYKHRVKHPAQCGQLLLRGDRVAINDAYGRLRWCTPNGKQSGQVPPLADETGNCVRGNVLWIDRLCLLQAKMALQGLSKIVNFEWHV